MIAIKIKETYGLYDNNNQLAKTYDDSLLIFPSFEQATLFKEKYNPNLHVVKGFSAFHDDEVISVNQKEKYHYLFRSNLIDDFKIGLSLDLTKTK